MAADGVCTRTRHDIPGKCPCYEAPTRTRTDRKGTAVRLPSDLLARLDAECELRVVGRNFIITRAIEHYLDALPPIEEGT